LSFRLHQGFFDEERRKDKSRGCFGVIMDIVASGSETVSSAQLKGAETTVIGIGDSERVTGDFEDSEQVLNGIGDLVCEVASKISGSNSVCMDMVAEEDGGMMTGTV
jgi:hypothetical protein